MEVVEASIPLVFVMGIVTTVTAFLFLRRDMKNGTLKIEPITGLDHSYEKHFSKKEIDHLKNLLAPGEKKFLAFMIPILFLLDVAAMFLLKLSGGDATALVGGTAIFILL